MTSTKGRRNLFGWWISCQGRDRERSRLGGIYCRRSQQLILVVEDNHRDMSKILGEGMLCKGGEET